MLSFDLTYCQTTLSGHASGKAIEVLPPALAVSEASGVVEMATDKAGEMNIAGKRSQGGSNSRP